jgi:hypothetical protein
MKKCPNGHENYDNAVFCAKFGCIHLFPDPPKKYPQDVAPIYRTYPVGTVYENR